MARDHRVVGRSCYVRDCADDGKPRKRHCLRHSSDSPAENRYSKVKLNWPRVCRPPPRMTYGPLVSRLLIMLRPRHVPSERVHTTDRFNIDQQPSAGQPTV